MQPTIAGLLYDNGIRALELAAYRRILILAAALALAACATAPPEQASEPSPASSTPLPVIEFAPAPAPIMLVDPFDGAGELDLEPLSPSPGDLWDRIVRGYAMPDIDAPLVERSRRYLYHIVSEVEARGMPSEIALLPIVESAFNPNALSVSRASGIWQFMPQTGKTYGLKQNWWIDSRRDVIAATSSALDYLQTLNAEFNDWQLSLAAYNWGEGNVRDRKST